MGRRSTLRSTPVTGTVPSMRSRTWSYAPMASVSGTFDITWRCRRSIDFDADRLHDLAVLVVIAADESGEFVRRRHERLDSAGRIELLPDVGRRERPVHRGTQAGEHG